MNSLTIDVKPLNVKLQLDYKFSISIELLKTVSALIDDSERKLFLIDKDNSEVQTPTKVRDGAFDTLEDWMSDFIVGSRVSLDGMPDFYDIGICKA